MSGTLFLGVDGGGSRCRARLENADGVVLGAGLSGPATMRLGIDSAIRSIMDAARQAFREANLDDDALARTYAGIGLAGTGQPGAREALEAWRHPFAGAWYEGDGYLALLGAFGGQSGGVVIVGTGTIATTRLRGRTVRIGGYGFPASDEGGGADLGLNALRSALRSLDGREQPSAFFNEVLSRFDRDTSWVAAWMTKASATEYATLAPIVVRHAQTADADAISLMQDAGAHVAELARALLVLGVRRVALAGGLAEHVESYLPEDVRQRLVAPKADAVAGGILLAKQRLGAVHRQAS